MRRRNVQTEELGQEGVKKTGGTAQRGTCDDDYSQPGMLKNMVP